eukprot:TRINITY_DN19573_c0_g1_i2.p1 TRINITY_DN19573_c0_g1~~TRINITY_DN19573_c0_g1_i2.p1  ORF type:complete len:434 (-),score=69.10 TRINITY_DN19573_c0_g1_i2:36-1337(-)
MEDIDLGRFLQNDFADIPQLMSLSAKVMNQKELAEVMVEFCRDHGILEAFLKYLIKLEIDKTSHPATLLREDSFLVNVLNTILYSDVGMKYLRLLIAPMIKTIIEKSKKGLVLKGVDDLQLKANSRRLVKILRTFLETFRNAPYSCPISLRETFHAVQFIIQEKFGTNDEILKRAPLVLDIIFFKFMCPTIIDPVRFLIVDDVPAEAKAPLLTVSKILNDLALNNLDKPWGDTVNDFIKENHPHLVLTLKTLTDKDNIEQHKMVIASSVTLHETTDDEKQHSRTTLENLIHNFQSNVPVASFADLDPMANVRLKELKQVINRNDWKLLGEKDGCTNWTVPTPDGFFLTKTEFVVNAPLAFVAKWSPIISQTREILPSLQLYDTLYRQDSGATVVKTILKSFFPLAVRMSTNQKPQRVLSHIDSRTVAMEVGIR